MLLGTAWFLYNLNNEAIADFAAYKKWMLIGFGAIGGWYPAFTCVIISRSGAFRMPAPAGVVHPESTPGGPNHPRGLSLVVWAYTWVICGMWFTVSPWRLPRFPELVDRESNPHSRR
jgi:hypothetical protein